MNIDLSDRVGLAMWRQQSIDQGLKSVGLSDDDLRVLHQIFGFDFHLQQLCCTSNTTQGIFNFMGQVSDQLLVGQGLIDDPLLAVLFGLLLQGQQLHKDLALCVGRGQNDMHRHVLRSSAFDRCIKPQGREVLLLRRIDARDDGFVFNKEVAE